MKESVKLARMKLATGALQALYATGSGRLEELFVAGKSTAKLERDEAADRAWQRLMMDGLVEDSVVEYDSDGEVRIADKERLSEILANTEDDGMLISEYVFPTRKRGGGETPAAPDDATPPASDEPALALLQVLIDAIGTNHKQFHEVLLQLAVKFDRTANAFNDLSKQVDEDAEHTEEHVRKINNRLDKLEERWAGTQRVVESMQTTLKTIATELAAFNGNVKAMVEMSTEVKAGAAAMARIAKETELGGRVRTLAGDVAAHTAEAKALHESLLELSADLAEQQA